MTESKAPTNRMSSNTDGTRRLPLAIVCSGLALIVLAAVAVNAARQQRPANDAAARKPLDTMAFNTDRSTAPLPLLAPSQGSEAVEPSAATLIMPGVDDQPLVDEPGDLPPLTDLLGDRAQRTGGYERDGGALIERIAIWRAAHADRTEVAEFYSAAALAKGFRSIGPEPTTDDKSPNRPPRTIVLRFERSTDNPSRIELLTIRLTRGPAGPSTPADNHPSETDPFATSTDDTIHENCRVLIWVRTPAD